MYDEPDQPDPRPRSFPKADFNPDRPKTTRQGRRLQRIREEIERNRTEGPAIPTWVLALALVVIVGGFAAIVVFSDG
ncbi:hypothetical protein Drose_17445 [Dactylosporangium roseum]|uniref:Uncharacterized protein n=1 Tax=Dactylosporangium roseum TaxID=47989 RepID=A0ABY5ZFJ0_9ACTN|nr:hypothetical protein [Dactylosporangium roseum]UWZ40854.1 hypothetical protein Drose_17445 [Dactylosporangium roseum]